jgi:hypothetical protein
MVRSDLHHVGFRLHSGIRFQQTVVRLCAQERSFQLLTWNDPSGPRAADPSRTYGPVSVASALQDRTLLVPDEGKRFSVTPAGAQWFADKLRIEIDALKPARHGIACGCLDWTERRYHLAGPLGTALLRRCFDLGFLRRGKEPRAVKLTVIGAKFLALRSAICRAIPGNSSDRSPTLRVSRSMR